MATTQRTEDSLTLSKVDSTGALIWVGVRQIPNINVTKYYIACDGCLKVVASHIKGYDAASDAARDHLRNFHS